MDGVSRRGVGAADSGSFITRCPFECVAAQFNVGTRLFVFA